MASTETASGGLSQTEKTGPTLPSDRVAWVGAKTVQLQSAIAGQLQICATSYANYYAAYVIHDHCKIPLANCAISWYSGTVTFVGQELWSKSEGKVLPLNLTEVLEA